MASIEKSLKNESEVEPGKVRLITLDEFVRVSKHSAWCDAPLGSEEVPWKPLNTPNTRTNPKESISEMPCVQCLPWLNCNEVEAWCKTSRYIDDVFVVPSLKEWLELDLIQGKLRIVGNLKMNGGIR